MARGGRGRRGSVRGAVFFNPGAGTVGSLQRRILNSPWVNHYNFAFVKDTRITERQSIQFRADFYNVFNHPTFAAGQPAGAPTDYNVNSLTFGRITTQYYSADGNRSAGGAIRVAVQVLM